MTKDQALEELRRIRAQLDVLGDPIFLSLEAAEDAAKDNNLARLVEASPIDRLALFRALFMTMNAVDHLAAHIEYLLKKKPHRFKLNQCPMRQDSAAGSHLRSQVSKMETDAWITHDWSDRPLEINREKLIQLVCRKCFRAFVNDATGRRYTIYASAFTVHRLSDEVTNRWLSEPCPNERQTADQEAARTRFENGSSTSTPNAK